ncbi:phage major capsid protein [Brachybacterium tyrofermentans]|uniref:phage major capsid protein n=1 Tax=Brachybacterium tyrofermentans TaxID=47848 RepID=UPI003F908BE1
MNLKKQRADALADAQAIAERARADGRDLTDDEAAQIDQKVAEVQELDKKLAKAAEDTARLARFAADDEDVAGAASRLIFGRKSAGRHAAEALMSAATGPMGRKVMPTSVPQTIPLREDALPIPREGRPVTVFDLLPALVSETPGWYFRQQVGRTFNAGIVGTGEVKPDSEITFRNIENRLAVFAHIAGPIPEHTLRDSVALGEFLQSELIYGLRLAVEDEVFTGDGTDIIGEDESSVVGKHFSGLLNTSGVLDQPFTSDAVTTIAAGANRLEATGFTVSGIAVHPDDWLTMTTTRNASGGFDLGGAVDAAARTVWGHQIVVSGGVPSGTAVALSDGCAAIRIGREGLEVRAITINDDPARNQVRLRGEGRFALDVYRPAGINVLHLTDAAG